MYLSTWTSCLLKSSRGSWVLTRRLSLPYPVEIPKWNICIPVVIWGLSVLSKKYFPIAEFRLPVKLVVLTSLCAILVPLISAAVSAVFAFPSDLRDCSSEKQWARLFQQKDEAAIRSVQDQLRCCGFNSMHDRAWPFPSRDNDARACERMQGYVIPCVGPWAQQAWIAAVLGGFASILNAIVVVSVCIMDKLLI